MGEYEGRGCRRAGIRVWMPYGAPIGHDIITTCNRPAHAAECTAGPVERRRRR